MRFTSLGLLLAVLAGSVWAGGLQKAEVAADAKWVAHADNEQFLSSRIGQLVLVDLEALGVLDFSDGLSKMLGLPRLADLKSITLYGPDADEKTAVALIKGGFDEAKATAAIAKAEQHEEIPYGGLVLHKWFDGNDRKTKYGVFAEPDTLVIGQSEARVKLALDVLAGRSESLAASDSPIGAMPVAEGAIWFSAAQDVAGLAAASHSAILKNAETASLTLVEKDGTVVLDAGMVMSSAEAAVQVGQILDGWKSLALLSQAENPVLATITRGVSFAVEDAAVGIHFEASSEEVHEFLKVLHQMHQEKRAAQ